MSPGSSSSAPSSKPKLAELVSNGYVALEALLADITVDFLTVVSSAGTIQAAESLCLVTGVGIPQCVVHSRISEC